MRDLAAEVPELLRGHADIRSVALIGSRAEGTAHELSDWDFAVEASDFPAVERDLPQLLSPLDAVAAQWDRYAPHATYMLILPGPTKIDLLFLDEKREWSPPWRVGPTTLQAIDTHFWDWILWLEQKRRAGRDELLAESLGHMHELLLSPMGIAGPPSSVADATTRYLAARTTLECGYGVAVQRDLERVVRPVLER
jgi:Polymerase beta, Nucleotidyltransferase